MIIATVFILVMSLTSCSPKKETSTQDVTNLETALKSGVPVLADFGRGFCIPCRKMKPILEECQREYDGKAIILFLDLKDHMEEAKKQKIRLIPTQIFFDKNKKEVYRHEGFMSKEEIVKAFEKIGVKLDGKSS
ncbi:MAG: hypothetical protein A2161_13240 [Candidatus Schekmanbacteria bacterium RBG_13_48_7]|uniref:Thioredoxin domain-containing protein n=1 Tax=Candidatus Schekmanbacteria bacterium RBG_13_48_7 TaxID=1817878 RepID=A0A1F7RRL1_9BACT|nr:MAG: hypothetical protein A2161_13240 [Candidatus Schekmanbacteria bacterium RBG_13_48_7]